MIVPVRCFTCGKVGLHKGTGDLGRCPLWKGQTHIHHGKQHTSMRGWVRILTVACAGDWQQVAQVP